jgi:hypothetical protein
MVKRLCEFGRLGNFGDLDNIFSFIFYIFGGLECVGHSFAYVAHFVFLRDVWIRTQRAAVASRCATNLATHLPKMGGF